MEETQALDKNKICVSTYRVPPAGPLSYLCSGYEGQVQNNFSADQHYAPPSAKHAHSDSTLQAILPTFLRAYLSHAYGSYDSYYLQEYIYTEVNLRSGSGSQFQGKGKGTRDIHWRMISSPPVRSASRHLLQVLTDTLLNFQDYESSESEAPPPEAEPLYLLISRTWLRRMALVLPWIPCTSRQCFYLSHTQVHPSLLNLYASVLDVKRSFYL